MASPKYLPKLLLYPDKLCTLPVLWELETVYSPEISLSLSIKRPRKYDDLLTIIECIWEYTYFARTELNVLRRVRFERSLSPFKSVKGDAVIFRQALIFCQECSSSPIVVFNPPCKVF